MTQLTLMDAINATLPAPVFPGGLTPRSAWRGFTGLPSSRPFGGYALVREYGRIGRGGRVMSNLYGSADEVVQAFERQRQAKRRRGYVQ